MKVSKKYQEKKKARSLAILKELSKKIRSGELILDECGFWETRTSNRVIFRITVISRDSGQEIRDFEKF